MVKFNINNLSKVFIIAEIGVNHEGSLVECKKLIKLAAKAGANAVKIQTVNEEESYIKSTQAYKAFKAKNFSDSQLIEIKKYSKINKILFFSTPGDFNSLERLKKIGVPIIKISSGLMNHYPLIKKAAKMNIPLIISTGMANKKDLVELKRYLNKIRFKKYAILKCTSEYPAKLENLNLKSLNDLKIIFQSTIGYSDHTIGITAPVAAVSLGAKIIEKHFTFNSKKKGVDHKISLEYNDFKLMVKKIREVEKMLGNKNFYLPKSLSSTRKSSRRYLFTKNNIQKGELFSLQNISFKRTNKNNNGLDPKDFYLFLNKKSKFNLKKDIILKKSFLNIK
jgi:N,N'-diacetyllegionaminate synthase